jgi:hypothetical protein
MLATHPQIATGPEPTFLLPLLKLTDARAVAATFDQRFTAAAIEDFLTSTGDAQATYDALVRAAADVAYRRAADEETRYFLDKTPKYHVVVDDLARIFADSPAIVLWRNPLAIIGSILATWGGGGGRWNLQHFRLDLYEGLPALIHAVVADPARFHVVSYEALVSRTHDETEAIFDHLGLDAAAATVGDFGDVELRGRIQDPNVGSEGFKTVRTDRVAQWRTVLANPVRQAWCRRYLRWLGRDRLAVMGYDLDELLADLASVPASSRFIVSDAVKVPYDYAYRTLELGMAGRSARQIAQRRFPLQAHK